MKLHNYQQRMIEFCKTTDNIIFSVGMGLGKTAAVLHYINETSPGSVLIVAPKRVAETVWFQEAEKWNLKEVADKMIIVSGTAAKRKKAMNDKAKPYKIISRDNLKDVDISINYDILILDELTSFKSILSKRSEAVRAISAKKKIGLTGTLLANGAIDVFPQAAAVGLENARISISRNGKYKWCNEFNAWRDRHFVDVMKGSGLQFSKYKLISRLEDVIGKYRNNIFTLDAADWLEIPEVSFIKHEIKLKEKQMSEYLQLETTLAAKIGDDYFALDNDKSAFMKLQTLCCGFVYDSEHKAIRSNEATKLEEVANFCERAASENEQVLLFYAFKEEAYWLAEMLKDRGLRYCSVSDKKFLQKWNDGDIDVLFAHPASAGHGLNLQSGGRLIAWSSVTYNYEFWAQANARLARQGQRRGVEVHTFATKDTCESRIYKAIREKEKGNEDFINLTK